MIQSTEIHLFKQEVPPDIVTRRCDCSLSNLFSCYSHIIIFFFLINTTKSALWALSDEAIRNVHAKSAHEHPELA